MRSSQHENRHGARSARFAVAATGLSLVLVACTPVPAVFLGTVDNRLAFKICEDVNVTSISISEISDSSSSVDGVEIWSVSAQAALHRGDVVVIGEPVSGLDVVDTAFEGVDSLDDGFALGIVQADVGGSALPTISASYQGDQMVVDKWLRAGDLGVVDDPC